MVYTLSFEDKKELTGCLDLMKGKDVFIAGTNKKKFDDISSPDDVYVSKADSYMLISDKNGNSDRIIDLLMKALDLYRRKSAMDDFGVAVVRRNKKVARKRPKPKK